MLVNLKSKINKIPQFPDKASTTKINLYLNKILDKNSVYHEELGVIIEKDMVINSKTKVSIDELKSYNTNWLFNYMSS